MPDRWQKQTILGAEDGNCFQACLASLLGLPLDEVPHFYGKANLDPDASEEEGTKVFYQIKEWLHERGYGFWCAAHWDGARDYVDGLSIVTGESHVYPGSYHSVVYKDGRPFFDPSPFEKFIKGAPKYWHIVYPLDPIAIGGADQ